MRCLYCGKELALLKRLRGGGDFCSDAHKHSYQEEYNRLALSRLLQAQKKGQQANNSQAPNTAPPPNAVVALQEPVREEAGDGSETAPMVEVVMGAVNGEEPEPEAVESPVSAEPEPLETAGFLWESPGLAALPEETPFTEPWLELSAGPAMSDLPLQNGATFHFSPADLLALDLRPEASSIEDRAFSADLAVQAFPSAQPDHSPLVVANTQKNAKKNRMPWSAAIAIDIAPKSVESDSDRSLAQAVPFDSTALVEDSQLLELSPIGIDFSPEDSEVVAPVAVSEPPSAEQPSPEAIREDNTPRASLVALSRLHQELAEQEAARNVAAPMEPKAEPITSIPHATVEVVRALPIKAIAAPAAEVEEKQEEALQPKYTIELSEISLRTFAPAKPAPMAGGPLPSHSGPLLPHLRSLPLRPKVALAVGYVPASNAQPSPETKPAAAASSAIPVRTLGPSKPAAGGKPVARLPQPKQPPQSAGQAQPAAAKAPVPRTTAFAKPVAKPVASRPAPVQEPLAVLANIPEATAKTALPAKAPVVESVKPPSEPVKPAADTAKAAAEPAKPVAEPAKPPAELVKPAARPAAEPATKDKVPSFDIAEPKNNSWIGSLKVKLGLAILILVIACAYFLGWGGGKPHSQGSNSGDGSGPSIIMGEGGWVESWGGDRAGLHAGRQITIYRPSLKLSDYRLEFQASIDAKSVGWVFRAADPDNYYAMKLMTVASGLTTKVALFKYLVANGKQTQVGRVPIDLAVQPDTVFNIRLDIRGPQFTTYIQGQQVDSWTDDQLKIGGAGFLNEREERGKVKSVSIRYLSASAK